MKSRPTLQTVILLALAPLLAALTAVWAWQLYGTTRRVILEGFDRKLLAVASSAAALVDGDGHEHYQRPQQVVALAPTRTGLAGWAEETGLVSINPLNGGARAVGVSSGLQARSLAVGDANRCHVLAADGQSLVEIDAATGQTLTTVALSEPVDGVFAEGENLSAWRGTRVLRLDPVSGQTVPTGRSWPEPLRSVAYDRESGRLYGLSLDGAALLVFEAKGAAPRRLPLRMAAATPATPDTPQEAPRLPPAIAAIAWSDGHLFAAGPSLLRVGPANGQVSEGEFTRGYFDVADPFYRGMRTAFIQFQRDAGLTYLYTQVYAGDKRIYYVMDGTTSGDYSRPGTTDEVPDAMVESAERVQLLGQTRVSGIQQWEPWGLVKSGFAPVRNTAGKVVAMAGADVDISVIQAKSRGALFAAIFIGFGSVLAAGFVSYRVARSLTRPLQELKETALWIAAGHYGVELKSSATRELSALASRLDALRQRLAAEGDQVYRWQDEIRNRRAQTALAQSLTDDPTGAGGRNPEPQGSCRRGDDFVMWLEQPEPDAAIAACRRARTGLLAGELLRSGREPAELPDLLLGSAPDLIACVAWQERTGLLHYRTSSPVTLLIDGVERRIEGRGAWPASRAPAVRWQPAASSGKGTT